MVRRLAIALSILVGANAFCQDVVIGAPTTSRNCVLTASITGYPASATKVSGTNEGFSVNAAISSATYTPSPDEPRWTRSYVSYMKVEIGGESLPVLTNTAGDWGGNKNLSVKWDTTHFGHGETEEIIVTSKMTTELWEETVGSIFILDLPLYTCVDSKEFEATAKVSVSIYNYASFCEIPEFTGSSNGAYGKDITDKFDAINTPSTSPQKLRVYYEASVGRQGVLDQLEVCTLFWIDSHGIVDPVPAICATSYGDDLLGWLILGSAIADARTQATTNGIPPINFAMLDCCYVGQSNSFCVNFLKPTVPGADVIDRCVTGWSYDVERELLACFTPKFYQELIAKNTVSVARTKAWAHQRASLTLPNGSPKYSNAMTSCLNSWGDLHTRITGLYDGTDNDASSSWFKLLE